MIRSTLAGLAGGLAWLVAMQLFFGPAQSVLADPARQSAKMLAAFGLDGPAPRMYSAPWLVPVALCVISIAWGWLYGAVARGKTWWRRGIAFGGIAWLFMVPWFEFYLPYNVLLEPLPLVALEMLCWLAVLLSVGLTIAGMHALLANVGARARGGTQASLLAAATVGSWSGCTSTQDVPDSPSALRIEAKFERTSERRADTEYVYESERLSVVLIGPKGKAIENDSLGVSVDGEPLELRVGQGNYYDRHPWYRPREGSPIAWQPSKRYALTVRWPDGREEPAASLETPPPFDLATFDLPRRHPRAEGLRIAWRDLAAPCELVLYRTHLFTDADGNVGYISGSANDPESLRREVRASAKRPSSDHWDIPASYLADAAEQRVSSVTLEATSIVPGKAAAALDKKSQVLAIRKLQIHVDLEPLAEIP